MNETNTGRHYSIDAEGAESRLRSDNARLRAENAALREVLGNLPDWILGCGTDDDTWATAWTPKNVASHVRYRIDDIQPSPTAAERATGQELYYIQNANQVCGNSAMWWGPNRGGYVCDLAKAGKYTKAECDSICGNRDRRDIPRKCSEMDAIAQRHVDMQDLGRCK